MVGRQQAICPAGLFVVVVAIAEEMAGGRALWMASALWNPVGVRVVVDRCPRVRRFATTLGFGVEPLRG